VRRWNLWYVVVSAALGYASVGRLGMGHGALVNAAMRA
jgi:hypothetical protein